jgi:hypothetical protein
MLIHTCLLTRTIALCLGISVINESLSLPRNILILQNGGGGHGSIGFELCRQLKCDHPNQHIHMIQEHTDMTKPPFSSYAELLRSGVDFSMAAESHDVLDLLAKQLNARRVDCVIDNWTKSPSVAADISAMCDAHKL